MGGTIVIGVVSSNITILELIWTTLGIFGILVNTINLRDTFLDQTSIRFRKINGDTQRIVKSHIRESMLRIFINVIVLVIGIVAMTQPQATPFPHLTITNVTITIGFFLIVAISIINAFMDGVFRRKLIERGR